MIGEFRCQNMRQKSSPGERSERLVWHRSQLFHSFLQFFFPLECATERGTKNSDRRLVLQHEMRPICCFLKGIDGGYKAPRDAQKHKRPRRERSQSSELFRPQPPPKYP